MIPYKFIQKLDENQAKELLIDRQFDKAKIEKALPRVDAKIIKYPDWKATCPKSYCEMTLLDIKDELLAWLGEVEEDITCLSNHLKKLLPDVRQLELDL